ncbi:MAG TPA: HAD-IA family hydrolase [Candidatus Thermoplasmatota archaeon]|nr:HAD-IA family hydrolase [Candidatus Thermoplasmatota archaeon]
MQPDAILWDLDGTLVDGAAAIHDAFEHAVREAGLPPVPRALVAARIGLPLRLMFRDLCQVDDRASADLVRSYRARFEESAPTLVRATPGAMDALAAFPHTPMAIVTTKAVDPARTVLRALGMEARFATIVGVDTVRRPKPDPEGVRVALSRLGIGALRTVFVGDTIMDVLAGKGAGVRTVAVLDGHGDADELRAAQPDAVIRDLRELAAAIASL